MTEHTQGTFIKNTACVEDGGSSDAMALYEQDDGTYSAYCRGACCDDDDAEMPNRFKNHNKLARSHLSEEYGIKRILKRKTRGERAVQRKKPNTRERSTGKGVLTQDQRARVEEDTSTKGGGYREIRDKWNKYYAVRTEYDEETGKVAGRYYPVTSGKTKLTGYKHRKVNPKGFFAIGKNSKESDMFGQFRCKGHGKYILIAGGEEDCIAAKQMLEGARTQNSAPVDVVSTSLGETSCAAQCKNHYDFFDGYDNIIVNMDNDEAGRKATESLIKVLPAGKVRVMEIQEKDACDMLAEGLEKEYTIAFYSAKRPKLVGIAGVSEIVSSIKETSAAEKIELPSFLGGVNKALAGGYLKSSFNILAAQTSIGKTSVANELLYFFIEGGVKVGLLSLEASKGFVGEQLMSLFLDTRLADIEDVEDKIKIVEKNEAQVVDFMTDDEGESNLFILDDRSLLGDVDSIFANLDKLIKGCGCEVIVIDVLSDLTDTMPIEEQAELMGKIKKLIAAQPVCVIGIMHMRKPSDKKNPHDVSEFDIYGSSTAIKSAHSVILLSRDKLAEDEDERNTTQVKLTKNRNTGRTGRMVDIFYNSKTGRLEEKDREEF